MSDYPKNCSHCKKQINRPDNYYSSVPGISGGGDLCNPCHEKWTDAREGKEQDIPVLPV